MYSIRRCNYGNYDNHRSHGYVPSYGEKEKSDGGNMVVELVAFAAAILEVHVYLGELEEDVLTVVKHENENSYLMVPE